MFGAQHLFSAGASGQPNAGALLKQANGTPGAGAKEAERQSARAGGQNAQELLHHLMNQQNGSNGVPNFPFQFLAALAANHQPNPPTNAGNHPNNNVMQAQQQQQGISTSQLAAFAALHPLIAQSLANRNRKDAPGMINNTRENDISPKSNGENGTGPLDLTATPSHKTDSSPFMTSPSINEIMMNSAGKETSASTPIRKQFSMEQILNGNDNGNVVFNPENSPKIPDFQRKRQWITDAQELSANAKTRTLPCPDCGAIFPAKKLGPHLKQELRELNARQSKFKGDDLNNNNGASSGGSHQVCSSPMERCNSTTSSCRGSNPAPVSDFAKTRFETFVRIKSNREDRMATSLKNVRLPRDFTCSSCGESMSTVLQLVQHHPNCPTRILGNGAGGGLHSNTLRSPASRLSSPPSDPSSLPATMAQPYNLSNKASPQNITSGHLFGSTQN